MVELGVMLGTGAGGPKDQAEARKLLERAAEAGNPRGVTISLLFPQMVVLHQIQAGQERCWRKRPKRTQRKLSINLD
jgi:TPR repeat protein